MRRSCASHATSHATAHGPDTASATGHQSSPLAANPLKLLPLAKVSDYRDALIAAQVIAQGSASVSRRHLPRMACLRETGLLVRTRFLVSCRSSVVG